MQWSILQFSCCIINYDYNYQLTSLGLSFFHLFCLLVQRIRTIKSVDLVAFKELCTAGLKMTSMPVEMEGAKTLAFIDAMIRFRTPFVDQMMTITLRVIQPIILFLKKFNDDIATVSLNSVTLFTTMNNCSTAANKLLLANGVVGLASLHLCFQNYE